MSQTVWATTGSADTTFRLIPASRRLTARDEGTRLSLRVPLERLCVTVMSRHWRYFFECFGALAIHAHTLYRPKIV